MNTTTDQPTDTTPDFVLIGYGLVYASVCTSLDDEQATARLNMEWPTGISSRWTKSSDKFHGGYPNPRPCERKPDTHRHILFVC
ncbi:hypothetical protein [Actinophytocola sp.]|uniref:hypothetical protein n=1 Tax=Actinophytocola sp. TaxID=1872138 RepID=UPI002D42D626|nr:hypothetical protein [Actinophytocola sp.]HYQ69048.1 hypothetical protein [Actinophytocola sp.]